MTNKYHYVYRITNTQENKHYYGVRSSKINPKLDLGIKYFSSSSDKEFIKEQKENKDIFKYKIIKQFVSRKEAVELEIKLHNKFDVGRNSNFYNRGKQTNAGWDRSGVKQPRNLPIGCKIMNNGLIYKLVQPDKFDELMQLGFRFGGHKSSHDKIMKLKSREVTTLTKQRMSASRADVSGSNNPMAKIIHIYDSQNNLAVTTNGNFTKVCEELDLPTHSLVKSYKNNGSPIGMNNYSIGNLRKRNHECYAGWYALEHNI